MEFFNLPETTIYEADDLFVKQYKIAQAGVYIPQHSHALSHLTLVGSGKIYVWRDGEALGEYGEGCAIVIPARTKHRFLTITPNTVLYCIHGLGSPEAMKVLAEHQLID